MHHGAGVDWFRTASTRARPRRTAHAVALPPRRIRRQQSTGGDRSRSLRRPPTFNSLTRYLGLERVHVVGHSASGCIALQMALEVPERVHSLALLEPALLTVPKPPEVPQPVVLYRGGEKATRNQSFFQGTCGPDYRAVLESSCSRRLSIEHWPRPIHSSARNCRRCGIGPFWRRRRPTDPAAGSRRARREERFTIPSAPETVARVAAERRAIRSFRRRALAASSESRRDKAGGLAAFVARHPLSAAG